MKLKILHHNVRAWQGYSNRTILSNYYLSEDPDVITLNEHGITHPNTYIKLYGYKGYTKGITHHAGVAILIRRNIQHKLHTKTTNPDIMAATLSTSKGKILVVTFYRPPRNNYLPLTDLQNFLNLNLPTIITADANIKHSFLGHNTSDRLGKLFTKFCQINNLHFMGPSFSTFYSGTLKGKPDIVCCNTPILLMANIIKEGDRLVASDHIPVHITISTNPIATPSKPQFNYNRANWPAFNSHMQQLDLPNINGKNTYEIDAMWQTLIIHMQNAANLHIPKSVYKITPSFSYSTKTKKLSIIYNNRHNLYKTNTTLEQKQILDKIKIHIYNSLRDDLDKYWISRLKEIEEFKQSNDPRNMYKNIKNIMGTKNAAYSEYLLKGKEKIYDPQEQANLFAKTWEGIMKNNPPRDNQTIKQHLENIEMWRLTNLANILPELTVNLNRLDKNNPLTTQIKLKDTIYYMNKIKSKAAGTSGLTPIIIKHTPIKTAIHITRLLNASLCTGYFPQTLKKGHIFLIPKENKNTSDPIKYYLT